MQQSLRFFNVLDFFIIVSCLGGAFMFWPVFRSHQPATVVVYRDNVMIAQYPLSSQKKIIVQGKQGKVTLSINNRGVCVLSADCPKQICVRTGAIKRSGQQIVCAPNHILVELETSSENGPDAITR